MKRLTFLLGLAASCALAQNEAQLGRWDFLYSGLEGARPVRWRAFAIGQPPYSWPEPDERSLYNPGGHDIKGYYGINAVLLPFEWDVQPGERQPRGVLMCWGYGWDSNSLNYGSYLLWHPAFNTGRRSYGFWGYIPDPDPGAPIEDRLFNSNIYGSSQIALPDGRLLFPGGAFRAPSGGRDGLKGAQTWNVAEWNVAPDRGRMGPFEMAEQRRYAGALMLPNGKALIVGGTHDNYSPLTCDTDPNPFTRTYEIFDPATNSLQVFPLNVLPCDANNPTRYHFLDQRQHLGSAYPRVNVVSYMQNGQIQGRVAYGGPHFPVYLLDPDRPELGWQRHANLPDPSFQIARLFGNAVLLPRMEPSALNPQSPADQVLPRVVQIGGANGCDPYQGAKFATIHDLSTGVPTWHNAPPLSPGRKGLMSVILPTGQIMVLGGVKKDFDRRDCIPNWQASDLSLDAYLLSPDANGDWRFGQWRALAPMPGADHDLPSEEGHGIPDGARFVHSSAVLLPDGRVWTGGGHMPGPIGGPAYVVNQYPTIYSPPYLFKSDGSPRSDEDRPTWKGAAEFDGVGYDKKIIAQIRVPEKLGELVSVALMSVTGGSHSSEFGQRLVRCGFSRQGDQVVIRTPYSPNIAPPGWYMMFLIVRAADGSFVPSTAAWIRLN